MLGGLGRLGLRDLPNDGRRNRSGDFRLNVEQVFQVTVEPLGPDFFAAFAPHQVCRHTHPCADDPD